MLLVICILLLSNSVVSQINVLSNHNNLRRTGWNDKESVLNTQNVSPSTFTKLFTKSVDDQIYAQPLIITKVSIAGNLRNIVLVATVNNSVYAFDADNAGTAYWQKNLTPVGSRVIKNTDMTGACGGNYKDFSGNMGIVGTPAIDTISNTMYVVARSVTTNNVYQQYLHAIDLTTGNEKPNSPIFITATSNGTGDGSVNGIITFNQQTQNQRAGLLLYNGTVYICWASHCDWGPYHGWMIGYDAATLEKKYVYNTTPDGYNAGIWMSGQPPSVDEFGNFYIATGNGSIGTTANLNDPINRGESLIKLNPQLQIQDFFTPNNYQELEDADLDYGSDGVLLIPNTHLSLSGSKQGFIYLMDNNAMGGMNVNNTNVLQKWDISATPNTSYRHLHGSPVYYKNSLGQEYVYAWAENSFLKQIPFNRTSLRFDVASEIKGVISLPGGMPGAMLSVSSNGNQAGTGIIWASHPFNGDANHDVVSGILRAFDANDVTKEIWNSSMNTGDAIGKFAKFVPPTIANGKVYMASFSNQLVVYGVGTPVKREPDNPITTLSGVQYEYFNGTYDYLPNFDALTSAKSGSLANFSLSPATNSLNYAFRYKGYIDIPSDGYYNFYTNSDDGSRLYIGDNLVVDNDGLHATVENYGSIGLKKGKHAITELFFQKTGGAVLETSYSGPGITKQLIPNSVLYRDVSIPTVAITSPIANSTNSSSVTITTNLTDSDNVISNVAFYSGTTLLGTDLNSPFQYEWNSIADGIHVITAVATDSYGRQSTSQPISFTTNVGFVNNDLLWSDEFNGSGAINSSNWFQQTQLPDGGGWYNGEMQHYTNSQTNSFQSNGSLNLVAKKETYTDQGVTKQYTSARLNSKFAFKYGRVEVRAKLPSGVGTWPAIWMLGKNIVEPGGFWSSTYGTAYWPACGEVDIMEHWGTNQNYVQSAMHTPSSYGGTVNLGGQTVATASSAFHIYTMDWTAEKIVFGVDGVTHYTYNPSIKNADTWPFDAEQYLLLNLAIQSNISSSFTQGAMEVDYVRVYKNTTVDSQAPTNFVATVGAITGSSVQLLLNATDNSGNVTYNVAYGSGTSATFGTSGIQKSLIIANLSPNTNYTFTVTATDAAGNSAVNNPILVTATTSANTTTACAGTTSESSQGTFATGYKYAFETIGTDVKFTFELLDADKVGVVAFLWKQTPFGETAMAKSTSGNIFTLTISGQTIGSTISYAVKFAYAGGMSVTKYFPYIVGSSCETSPTASSQTFCVTATVASLVATGTALKWYDVSTGGTALSSSTALTTKTYYVSQTLAGTESARTPVSVTITPAATIGSISASTCGSSYTWSLNGQSYTSSGTYTYIVGCNTATLTLVLTNVTTNGSVIQSQAGGSYTWPVNGQTYTASTTQTVVSGCNTATLNLTITPVSSDTQPTISAPLPTKLAADVKSIFSDTYTNISTIELFPDWGQGTKYVNYTIPASSPVNNVIKYSNLDYQGINITAAGNSPGVDFSAMTTLHIDVWTPDVASFKLFPIDNNTDLIFKTLTPTKSGWNSYDIVLATDFPTLNKASIRQFKFEKTAFVYKGEINTIYFDNIYFWRAPAVGPTASSQTFCGIATVSSLVATGSALKWYDVSVGGTALSSSTALTTKTYFVSQTLAGTESARTAVSVTITPATTIGSISASTCGSSYTWPLNGQSYTYSGTYTYIVGCNTATLTLVLMPATNHTTTVSSLNTYTWTAGNGQTYTTSGIKTGVTTNCVTELLDLTITTEIPSAFPYFCKGATIATATGLTSLKFYTVATGGSALAGNTALTTRTLYLTETKNGNESTQRVAKSIVVNALPATPSALISTQSAVICKYIGTTNPVTFTATAVGASFYNWTLPTGASILSGTESNAVTVSFENVSTAPGNIGAVIVNSVDENGCISIAKSLALTTKIPTASSILVLTSADSELGFNVSGVPTSLSSLVKITKVGPYIGTTKEFTLTAAAAPTADQYRWELPEGVNIISDNTTIIENGITSKLPEITIDFAGVTLGTANLVIKVYSVGGCGESTAKTLTLFRALPTKPAALVLTGLVGNDIILPIGTANKITKVSPFVGKSTQLTLIATPVAVQGATATSYQWEFPYGVTPHGTTSKTVNNVTTISSTSNIITVDFEGVQKAVLLLPISVYAVNGAGRSLIKTLTLTSAVPTKPSSIKTPSLAVPKFNPNCATSTNIAVQVPSEAGCTYAWTVAGGTDRVISGNGTHSIVINVDGVTTPTLSVSVVVSNGTGSSEAITLAIGKTTTCGSRIAPKAVVTDEFSIVAYPNPSLSEFTLDIQSSSKGDTGLQVYDVAGRMMENRQVKSKKIQIGTYYPSGTYILKVSQDENMKTLRIIKNKTN